MGTGTGAGTETRAVAEMGTGTRITGTGTRTGSGRAEERRRSARNRTRVVDAIWETWETWEEKEKHDKKGLVQYLPVNPDKLENSKEAWRGNIMYPGLKDELCEYRECVLFVASGQRFSYYVSLIPPWGGTIQVAYND